jgi:hypothetical protein
MTKFIVHIYREMKLSYADIEADTPQDAAAIARDKPTADADNVEDCEGQNLAALVDVAGDEDFSQSVTVDFEPERHRKAASALLAACRLVVARWEHGDLAEAARACGEAIAVAEDALPSVRSPLEITEDEFDRRFSPVTNHLNPNACWGSGETGGCLFETYGEELEFVRRQDARTVWTFVDGDDGDQYLLSGFHFVNRIGYLISTMPVPEGADIQVRIPMENPDDAETGKAAEA